MPEIPAVYGEWPEPPCCGDPADCHEECELGGLRAWIAPGTAKPTKELLERAIEAGRRAGMAPKWTVIAPLTIDPRVPPGGVVLRTVPTAELQRLYAMKLPTICTSCEEERPAGECPSSQRACGHHCNHSWSHDDCCWCSCHM